MEQTITLEYLYQRTVSMEETLQLILGILTKEEKKKTERKGRQGRTHRYPSDSKFYRGKTPENVHPAASACPSPL